MKNKRKIIIVLIVTGSAITLFGVVLMHAIFYTPVDEVVVPVIPTQLLGGNNQTTPTFVVANQKATNTEQEPIFASSYPKELLIPSLGINANVQYVGVTSKGNMATPNNFSDVGWYKYGPVPGEQGNAVIAGHVDNGLAFPAVFQNLENLKPGDDVYLNTVGGESIHFVVKDLKVYDPNAPTQDIFNKNDGKFLTLITCTGTWIPEKRGHNKRLVVTAERI